MRGAHRCVWCSKSTPLIEAELFAAESKRPAPDGRALSCAAPYARKIQGLTASQNLPDARNRAPVSLVSPRDRRESRRKGRFGGVKRGQGNHTVPLPPFAPPAVGTASSGRRRRPLSTPSEGVKSPPPAAPLYRRKVCHQQTVKKRHGRRNGGKAYPLLRDIK